MDILTPEKKPPKKTEMIGVRLEKPIYDKLCQLAAARGMTPSSAARVLITHVTETLGKRIVRGSL